MNCARRIAALGAVCSGLICAMGAAHADQTYNTAGKGALIFKRYGHNQWGAPGEFGLLDWRKTHPFADSRRIGPIYDFGIDFGFIDLADTIGAGLEVGIAADAGIGIQVTGKNGEINVVYPMNVVLSYPDPRTLRPGDTFVVSSSFDRAGSGSLWTTAPNFGFKLSGLLTVSLGLDAVVYYPGPFDSRATIIPPQSLNLDTTIFDTDFPGFKEFVGDGGHFELFEGVVEGTYAFPSVVATGGNGPGTSLTAFGSDEFISVQASITEAIIMAITGVNVDLQDSGSFGPLTYEYSLLDLYLNGGFSILQNFEFNPRPIISLQLSNGETKSFYAGESITLTMPAAPQGAAANDLTITPTFTTEGTVRNKSDLRLAVGLYFNPLTVRLGVHIDDWVNEDTPYFSPFGIITILEETFDVGLIDKTFTMKGFNAINRDPFTVEGYRYPTPILSEAVPRLLKLNSAAFSLNAAGANFVDAYTNAFGTIPGSKVLWDGNERPTTFGGPAQLTASISAGDVAVEGAHQVRVRNPSPGGGLSNPVQVLVDGSPPVITGAANPAVLDRSGNPNLLVSITISGRITDALAGVDPTTARYAVDDEYNLIEPAGPVTLNSDGTYSFVVRVSPTRQAKDTNGRLYSITIEARDKLGFAASKTVSVIVPQ